MDTRLHTNPLRALAVAALERHEHEPIATDETLLRRARQGDDVAVGTLLSRYRTFVRRKAQTYYVPGADSDDVVQEGMIGLYKAVIGFDPERGHFRAFADLCVSRQISTAIAAARRKRNAPLNWSMPLSGAVSDDERELGHVATATTLDPADSVLSSEERADLGRFIRTALTPLERDVLVRYLDGHSYERIAAALGKTPKSVDNALQRIRRKVSTVYLGRAST